MARKNKDTSGTTPEQVIRQRLAEEIQARELSLKAAAAQVGVTVGTLQNHLGGEHIRSDSARKYADWISGRTTPRAVFQKNPVEQATPAVLEMSRPALPAAPARPYLVVDIFAGCGGLSLGFDILGEGAFFETALAMDIQPSTVEVMNRNHPAGAGCGPVAREVDLTEFANETEILAFYLDHVCRRFDDRATRRRLDRIAGGSLPRFLTKLATIDGAFIEELTRIRLTAAFQKAFDEIDRQALLQTSVSGFHDRLKLPKTGRGRPTLPNLLWSDASHTVTVEAEKLDAPPRVLIEEARQEWDAEVQRLAGKQSASGKGQLTSSARRIASFVGLLLSEEFKPVRAAWCRWRAARQALRAEVFGSDEFAAAIRGLYEQTYPVSVLLGGPPCQGFSRIGRGKIRSLREAMVHVHTDEDAGDERNRLYERYLLVASAFRPLVFKFENVQHFQSTLKLDGKEFLATELLAEAIAEMAHGEVAYTVSSRTIDASKHGVPQTRQRFFMSGVRADAFPAGEAARMARECLELDYQEEVPLSVALDGLAAPVFAGGDIRDGSGLATTVPVAGQAAVGHGTASERLRAWYRQPGSKERQYNGRTDAHIARAARHDDAELFALMGPGKRWMDYRVEDAPTLVSLRNLLTTLAALDDAALAKLNRTLPAAATRLPPGSDIADMACKMDGSLVLRLLMEQIGVSLDASHHLATESYLSKRDGQHGDWLARLDGQRPCKTIVAHMGKDSYGYVHPQAARTLSAREAARVQTFPDWFSFGDMPLTDTFKMIGNAVPPLLSHQIAERVAHVLSRAVGYGRGVRQATLKVVGGD